SRPPKLRQTTTGNSPNRPSQRPALKPNGLHKTRGGSVDANALVGKLHDRMPLILAPADYDAWLDAGTTAAALPHAVAAEEMVAYPVSPLVSNARNDDPACLVPIDTP
ncbi:MAG: SOS response-associated peptidase family protein, partial [Thiobacillus sp.]